MKSRPLQLPSNIFETVSLYPVYNNCACTFITILSPLYHASSLFILCVYKCIIIMRVLINFSKNNFQERVGQLEEAVSTKNRLEVRVQVLQEVNSIQTACYINFVLRGYGAQGFPTPDVNYCSRLDFLKCTMYIENSTMSTV